MRSHTNEMGKSTFLCVAQKHSELLRLILCSSWGFPFNVSFSEDDLHGQVQRHRVQS